VAVDALHGVNVVRALRRLETGIHLLDIEAAIRELRMTVGARGARGLSMLLVAGEAAEALMNTNRSAVVAGADLRRGGWGMALITQRLPRIGADLDRARAIVHLRHWKAADGNVVLLAAVEQSQRWAEEFLARCGFGLLRFNPLKQISVAMHLVAGQAWHCRLSGELSLKQLPRTVRIDRRNQIANAALEMHAVAAEAIFHQKRALVVVFVEENLGIGGAVATRGPVRIFFAMAFGAAFLDFENIVGFQLNLLRNFSAQMRTQAAKILQMKSGVQRENVTMAFGARDIPMRGLMPVAVGLPDLVTPRAGLSSGVVVIKARAGES